MIPTVVFNNVIPQYTNEVTHLGHILTPDLDDKNDIIRAVKRGEILHPARIAVAIYLKNN